MVYQTYFSYLEAASVPEMSVRIGEELLEATSKGQYRVQEGDLLTVQCEAHEGNPEPVLALFIDEEQVNIYCMINNR